MIDCIATNVLLPNEAVRRQRRTYGKIAGAGAWLAAVFALNLPLFAQTNFPARFLGTQSCASSGCHGGAGAHQNQFLVWSTRDFHSQRPFATLTTARSKQIAEALKITEPAREAQCTSCHAPLAGVPARLQAAPLDVREGISCESCHGPAEQYLRPHTRPDYTRADRTAVGLRDLRHLYVRANTCIACHQTVDTPLVKAGHPELIFELDGQSVTEPKHWRSERDAPGPQAWLVGQAAALRELSWQVSREPQPDAKLEARMEALAWLLRQGGKLDAPSNSPGEISKAADRIALSVATTIWTEQQTRHWLLALAGTAESFRDSKIPKPLQARRAERLVLALDRLVVALNLDAQAGADLRELFRIAQSGPDFEAAEFAVVLERFAKITRL